MSLFTLLCDSFDAWRLVHNATAQGKVESRGAENHHVNFMHHKECLQFLLKQGCIWEEKSLSDNESRW